MNLGHRPQACYNFSVAELESESGQSHGLPGFSSLLGPRKGPEAPARAAALLLCDLERRRPLWTPGTAALARLFLALPSLHTLPPPRVRPSCLWGEDTAEWDEPLGSG